MTVTTVDDTTSPDPGVAAEAREATGWRRTWLRFRRKRVAVAALVFTIFAVILAIAAPWIAPYGLGETTGAYLVGPSREYPLGTNAVGYDTLSQLLYGLRTSLYASGVAVVLGGSMGMLIGLVSGYFGGRTDRILMRLIEAIMVIPNLILAVAVLGVLGPSVRNAMIGLAVGMTPGFARLIRGQVLSVREETFVEAAKVCGSGPWRNIRRHIVPNILPFAVVQIFMSLGFALLAEGGLAFLGLSAQPPETSLGAMLRAGFVLINQTPRLIIIPGVAITLLSVAFNLIADGLRDSLAMHDVSDAAGAQ